MPCHLIDLPIELQLKITKELLGYTDVNQIDDDKEEDLSVRRSLTKNKSGESGRVAESGCKISFIEAVPQGFTAISLRPSLSKVEHSTHVKELIYAGSALGNARKNGERYSDVEAILPESVAAVLSHLHTFPNLEFLCVEFPYHFANDGEWKERLDLYEDEESDDCVKLEEKEVARRALMAKSWEALIQNEAINLKVLNIRKLGPVKISTFNDHEFHRFLGQFKQFNLSIHGHDKGAGWDFDDYLRYRAMMSRLDIYFFNHLSSVTELVLQAPEKGPLGLEGLYHVPLALKEDQMPALRIVYLENILIGPELIKFLLGHRTTLESVTLRKCSAQPWENSADYGIPWNEFFDSLKNFDFERLRHFELQHHRVPLTRKERYGEEEDQAKVPAKVRKIRQILENDESRRLFPYTKTDVKYGIFSEDERENLPRFEGGEDQASYDEFMASLSSSKS